MGKDENGPFRINDYGVYCGPKVYPADLIIRDNPNVNTLGCLETVLGDLIIVEDSPIVSLGNLLYVRGSVNVRGTCTIRSTGLLREVGGFLDISGSGVAEMPVLEKVHGFIRANGSELLLAPRLKHVGSYMNLAGCRVRDINSLRSCRRLYLAEDPEDYKRGALGILPYDYDYLKDPDRIGMSMHEFRKVMKDLHRVDAPHVYAYLYDPRYAHSLFKEELIRRR